MLFNLNELEIMVSNEKRNETFSSITFFGEHKGKEIGWLITDRYYHYDTYNKYIKNNYFEEGIGFPYVLSMNVEKEYRGNGIMMKLLLYANEYWKNKGYVLHSGVSNEFEAKKVFDKLVDFGKMEKIKINSKDRYKFIQ